MFVHTVKTSRNVDVNFGFIDSTRQNQMSLLIGPNGSGKTDILATIAQVFHGEVNRPTAAEVRWSRGTSFRHAQEPMSPRRSDYERVHLIAQTFSPFSRFPAPRKSAPLHVASVYSRGDFSEEEYVCVGFNQNSNVELRRLPLSIIETAILRLSERPATAKVAFDVLRECGFKDGIKLTYVANKCLSAMIALAGDFDALRTVLANFERTGNFVAHGEYFGKRVLRRLREELKRGSVEETSEYLQHAINLTTEYIESRAPVEGMDVELFRFSAFHSREGMSSDFPYLQAFAVLARLELVTLVGCSLTPFAGQPVDLTKTSSGQQQMLCSFFGLAAALEDHSLVLIDEPELSLHPRWQMNYFRHLETALEAVTDCHVIIATHSALIAQGAVTHGVRVVSLGDDPGLAHLQGISRRDVASVEEVLVDAFDTPVKNSLHISKEIFGLVMKAESGTQSDRYASIEQLRRYLALYRRQGEGSREMVRMLEKALKLAVSATPA